MTLERHLQWHYLEEIIDRGVPQRIAIDGTPEVAVQVEGRGEGLHLLVPMTGVLHRSAVADLLIIGQTRDGDTTMATIGTRDPSLFREAYQLFTALADDVQLDGKAIQKAIDERIAAWRRLIRAAQGMSRDAELGLIGELWALDRLAQTQGLVALDEWVGPGGDIHDFSTPVFAIEVKTTTGKERVHRISDARQLVKPPERTLYLLSIQLQPVGGEGGLSLPMAVGRVRERFAHSQEYLRRLEVALGHLRYSDVERDTYSSRYAMRAPPTLIEITDAIPAVTQELLEKVFGPRSSRVEHLEYDLNCTGIGSPDGSPGFLAVLPRAQEEGGLL